MVDSAKTRKERREKGSECNYVIPRR